MRPDIPGTTDGEKMTPEQLKLRSGTSEKKVREKSRECHNHKPQPFPDPEVEVTDPGTTESAVRGPGTNW